MADSFVGLTAEGAYPNGTRIEKCNTEDGDTFPDGTLGTVKGSIGGATMQHPNGTIIDKMYAIEWDPIPGVHIMITNNRIKEHESANS